MEWMQALRPLSIFRRPCGRVSPPAACSTHVFPGSKWICCICRLLLAAIDSYCLAKYSLASWSFFILTFFFSFFLRLKVPHTAGGLRSRAGCPLPHLFYRFYTGASNNRGRAVPGWVPCCGPSTHSRDREAAVRPRSPPAPPGFPPRPFMKWRRHAGGGRGPGPAPGLCKGRGGRGARSRAGLPGCCRATVTTPRAASAGASCLCSAPCPGECELPRGRLLGWCVCGGGKRSVAHLPPLAGDAAAWRDVFIVIFPSPDPRRGAGPAGGRGVARLRPAARGGAGQAAPA